MLEYLQVDQTDLLNICNIQFRLYWTVKKSIHLDRFVYKSLIVLSLSKVLSYKFESFKKKKKNIGLEEIVFLDKSLFWCAMKVKIVQGLNVQRP